MLMLPLLVAAAGVGASVALHQISADNARNAAEARFEADADAMASSVVDVLSRYEKLNASTAEATTPIDGRRVAAEEFTFYVDSLILPTRFPAVFGVGLAEAVPRAQLETFLADPTVPPARVTDLGPEESEGVSAVVTYGGPETNMAIARGIDAMRFPQIADALNRSWATGEPMLSAPLDLPLRVGPGKDDPPTLLFLADPIYGPSSFPSNEVADIRPIEAWAAVVIDAANLPDVTSGAVGSRYAMTIDDLGAEEDGLVASNNLEPAPGGRSTAIDREVFGRRWRFTIQEADGVVYGDPVPNDALLAGGLAATAVVFAVVTLLTWSERRARRRVERATAELAIRAATDELTGLANRAQLRVHINDLLRAEGGVSRSVAVLYLDLDRFKLVNDSLGHAAGDELLREVAKRLLDACSDDHVVARLGGDEFVVVVPAGDLAEAQAVAQRVRDALSHPFVVGTEELFVQVSIGIALADAATDADTVLQRADAAMYAAKDAEAGGIALFTPSLLVRAEERLALARDLRHAMDQHQFHLAFQQINRLDSGAVVGYEALIRWHHPHRGDLLPGSFLPTAKETGLIEEIDAWVRGEAVRTFSGWEDDALVSVNVSARDLEVPGFTAGVLEELDTHQLDPRRLVLEITETDLAADPAEASRVLGDLRATGVRVAVDDFGTGYSGLSNLRSLPADLLKIDRSLVAAAPLSPEDRAVLRVIIELGHALGLEIVAEGVETERHMRVLMELGCDLAQGWYFGREVEVPGAPDTGVERRGTVARDRRRSSVAGHSEN
jgi:diguanylate cyclase (GGDEF)-like protein